MRHPVFFILSVLVLAAATLLTAAESESYLRFELVRFQHNGEPERSELRCPAKEKKDACDAIKVKGDQPIAQSTLPNKEAEKLVKTFFKKLPAKDVVSSRENEEKKLDAKADLILAWTAILRDRKCEGAISRTDVAALSDENRKRIKAVNYVEWKLMAPAFRSTSSVKKARR